MAIKHKLTAALVAFFVLALGVAVYVQKTDHRFFGYSIFKKVQRGMPETEVASLLGPPASRHEITDIYDISYKITGYTFRAFKAKGTIFVYERNGYVCYILFQDGRVADSFIGNR